MLSGLLKPHNHPSLIPLISESQPFPAYSLLSFRECSKIDLSETKLGLAGNGSVLLLLETEKRSLVFFQQTLSRLSFSVNIPFS